MWTRRAIYFPLEFVASAEVCLKTPIAIAAATQSLNFANSLELCEETPSLSLSLSFYLPPSYLSIPVSRVVTHPLNLIFAFWIDILSEFSNLPQLSLFDDTFNDNKIETVVFLFSFLFVRARVYSFFYEWISTRSPEKYNKYRHDPNGSETVW